MRITVSQDAHHRPCVAFSRSAYMHIRESLGPELARVCAPTPFQEILTSRTGSTIARKQLPSRSKADFMPSVRSTQNQSRRGRAWPVSAPPSITNSLPVE